jgi:hypothetical protein
MFEAARSVPGGAHLWGSEQSRGGQAATLHCDGTFHRCGSPRSFKCCTGHAGRACNGCWQCGDVRDDNKRRAARQRYDHGHIAAGGRFPRPWRHRTGAPGHAGVAPGRRKLDGVQGVQHRAAGGKHPAVRQGAGPRRLQRDDGLFRHLRMAVAGGHRRLAQDHVDRRRRQEGWPAAGRAGGVGGRPVGHLRVGGGAGADPAADAGIQRRQPVLRQSLRLVHRGADLLRHADRAVRGRGREPGPAPAACQQPDHGGGQRAECRVHPAGDVCARARNTWT